MEIGHEVGVTREEVGGEGRVFYRAHYRDTFERLNFIGQVDLDHKFTGWDVQDVDFLARSYPERYMFSEENLSGYIDTASPNGIVWRVAYVEGEDGRKKQIRTMLPGYSSGTGHRFAANIYLAAEKGSAGLDGDKLLHLIIYLDVKLEGENPEEIFKDIVYKSIDKALLELSGLPVSAEVRRSVEELVATYMSGDSKIFVNILDELAGEFLWRVDTAGL